jgi:hypothetical protein
MGFVFQYDGSILCAIPWHLFATTQVRYQKMTDDILDYARQLVANQPMKLRNHHKYDLEIPSDLHWELVKLGAELKMDYEVYAEEVLKMHAEDAISKRITAKAYSDPSWVYKLNLECVEEEDGTMSINIEWDEKDPDLQYWTNLGPKGQEDFILTALRSACDSVLSDYDN